MWCIMVSQQLVLVKQWQGTAAALLLCANH
jgi:hypothetical protein